MCGPGWCISGDGYGVAEPNSRDSGRREMFWWMRMILPLNSLGSIPMFRRAILPGVCAGVPCIWVRHLVCSRLPAICFFCFCLTGTEQKEDGSSEISYNPTNRLANPHVFSQQHGLLVGERVRSTTNNSSGSSDLRNPLAVGNT
jgi:hypothetical protein